MVCWEGDRRDADGTFADNRRGRSARGFMAFEGLGFRFRGYRGLGLRVYWLQGFRISSSWIICPSLMQVQTCQRRSPTVCKVSMNF